MSLIDTFCRTVPLKFNPAGYPFIAAGLIATIAGLLIWNPAGIAALFTTLFILFFFRDPDRTVPQRDGLIIAPADGRVVNVSGGQSLPDDLSNEDDSEDYTKVSIFSFSA